LFVSREKDIYIILSFSGLHLIHGRSIRIPDFPVFGDDASLLGKGEGVRQRPVAGKNLPQGFRSEHAGLDLRRDGDSALAGNGILGNTAAEFTGEPFIENILDDVVLDKGQLRHHLLAGNFRCCKCQAYHVFERMGKPLDKELQVALDLKPLILDLLYRGMLDAHHQDPIPGYQVDMVILVKHGNAGIRHEIHRADLNPDR